MQEIFWGDYNIDEKKTIDLIQNGSSNDKRFIFEKIIANSKNIFKDLSYFEKEELKKLLDTVQNPIFNKEFIEKRVKIAKNIFFDEPCYIRELEWR